LNIKVVEKEEMKVVGISWNGTYSQLETVPQLFREMKGRLQEVPNPVDDSILVAPFHGRETEFTYYVTTPVKEIQQIPEGMVGFTIPRKNYVCTTHKGSIEEVENTYQQVLKWMSEYGYDHDEHALSLEIFHVKDKNHNKQDLLHFELYLPVKTYK